MTKVDAIELGDTQTQSPVARNVDAGSAHQFDWGSIQWLVSDKLEANAQLTFGHVEIKAGYKNPLHQHPNCDEVLFLVEGNLDHSVNGDVVKLQAGSSIFIPKGAPHDAFNNGNVTAKMVVAYSSGDRQTVMLEDGEE